MVEEDDWEEVIVGKEESSLKEEEKTGQQKIMEMTDLLNSASLDVYHGKFETSKSDKFAALALSIQIELIKFLPNAELLAKQAKQEVKHTSADVHHKYRSMQSEKKITDAALAQLINRDPDVKVAEAKQVEFERNLKQLELVADMSQQAHIYFRNYGKKII